MENWTEILAQLKESRKGDILQCAKSIFMEQGFAHVTMKDIANRAGISRTTLYKYFKNIEEIAYTIQVVLVSEIDNFEGQKLQKYDSLEEKLASIIEESYAYTLAHMENRRFTMMFDSYYRGNDVYSKNISEEIKNEFDDIMKKLQDDRTALVYEGFCKMGTDDHKRAEVFAELFCGLVIAHNQRIASGGYHSIHILDELNGEFERLVLNYFHKYIKTE